MTKNRPKKRNPRARKPLSRYQKVPCDQCGVEISVHSLHAHYLVSHPKETSRELDPLIIRIQDGERELRFEAMSPDGTFRKLVFEGSERPQQTIVTPSEMQRLMVEALADAAATHAKRCEQAREWIAEGEEDGKDPGDSAGGPDVQDLRGPPEGGS